MRRVVTGLVDGRSVFLADGEPTNAHHYAGWPGHRTAVIWTTLPTTRALTDTTREPNTPSTLIPEPGGTTLMIVRFPPDAVLATPAFDVRRYGEEAAVNLPGLIETFEADGSGFHRTPTIDYDVVVEGEVWLELDEGETRLRQGDVVVQGGARHAWRNRSERDAVMLFVLVGAAA